MRFRSNAPRHFPAEVIHSRGQKYQPFPQDDPASVDADLLWLTGSESPIERKTLLGELYAERFGLHGKAAR